jgi:PKD domain
MHTRLPAAIVITAALWLIAATTASAQTFCVQSDPSCTGTPAATLTSALTDAANNGNGRDTIQLPAGVFAEGPVVDSAGNPVDIVGAGMDSTVITSQAAWGNVLVINEPSSTVSQLEVRVPGSDNFRAIVLNGTIDHVKVTSQNSANGVVGVYVDVGSKATIKHSKIDLGYTPTSEADGVSAAGSATLSISDTDIAASLGVYVQESSADIERTRIWAKQGIELITAAYAYVANSSIRTPGRYAHTGPEYAFETYGVGPNILDVLQTTAYGDGDVGSTGVLVKPMFGEAAVVSLTDSAIAHYAIAADVNSSGGNATLNTVWSAYDFTRLTGGGLHAHAHDVDLAGVDPGFVDGPGGDLRLRWNSPLVDAGDPAASTSGLYDRDGNERYRDGGHGIPRVDIGAIEYQHATPTITAAATPTSVVAGQPVSFSATGGDSDPGEQVTVAWSFDDGGSADGLTAEHAFATGGTHTATATATDASGQHSSAAVTVAVADPPAPGNPATGAGAADNKAVAPVLTGLHLSRTAFRARAAHSTRRTRVGTKLSFKLSEAATVTFVVERANGKKWARVGSFKVRRGAGPASVHFDGRVGRKVLRSGKYRLRVTARDQSGLGSKQVLAKFRIVR